MSHEPSHEPATHDVETSSFAAHKYESLTMTWKDLHFHVKKGEETQELLTDISGAVHPGELLAIMGPSGAGKSTMMNVLASRAPYGKHSGTIAINGHSPKKYTKKIAYVMQEDALFSALTPRETLHFTAGLKLPELSVSEKDQLVESVLELLGLKESADSRIASIPGEKKRVAVAVELISSPSLIFLDEPTSHLDSYSAFELVKHLRTLAKAGCTIVCTIHQPSSEVFDLFDKVMLLCRGKCVYNGPVDGVVAHFATAGIYCKPNYNPADFAMHQLQVRSDEELAPLVAVTKKNNIVDESSSTQEQVEEEVIRTKASFGAQCWYLTKRDFMQTVRDSELIGARFGMAMVQALLVGLYFLDCGHEWGSDDSPDSISRAVRNHWSAIQFCGINAMFGSAQPMLLAFPMERPVFIREYATGTYSTTPYFIAKTLVEFPAAVLQVLIQFIISYFMVDMQGNFFYLCVSCGALGLVTSSTALIIGAATTRPETALNIAPLVYVPQMIASGIFLTIDGMPSWIRWVQWLCPLKYGVALASISELSPKWVPDDREAQVKFLLEASDIVFDDWWIYAIILAGMFCIFRVISAVILARRAKTFA